MKDEKRYTQAGLCPTTVYPAQSEKPPAAIDNSMSNLAQALYELEGKIMVLIDRINPVLIPTGSGACNAAADLKPCASELRQRVDNEANRVYELTEAISGVIARLEI